MDSKIKKSLAALVITGASALVFSSCAPVETAGGSSGGETTQSQPEKTSTKAAPKPKAAKPKPTLSVSQMEAIESAESYLDSGDFSKKSLISQLKYEDYSTKEATYAVNHVEVNWTSEADDSAESYLDSGSFSRKSLLSQLKYEGFTDKQAAHGVKSVGL